MSAGAGAAGASGAGVAAAAAAIAQAIKVSGVIVASGAERFPRTALQSRTTPCGSCDGRVLQNELPIPHELQGSCLLHEERHSC